MGTFVGTQYACIYPDHIDSLTLLDYPGEVFSAFDYYFKESVLGNLRPQIGISLFNPKIVPIYARMSLESRYDRWVHDQKNLKSRPKTKEEFKNALQGSFRLPHVWRLNLNSPRTLIAQ